MCWLHKTEITKFIHSPSDDRIYGSGPQSLWHQGPVSRKIILPEIDRGWGDDFRMIQAHYIYCTLYFYYHIMIYNKISTQLTITQNQWEPWACFPATRWSHLGVMGDSGSCSPVLATLSQLHLRSSGIRFSQGARNLDPSHAQFTVGLELLWESNDTADLTRGRAQAIMGMIGRGCKYRWDFTHLPTAYLLLCNLVPNGTIDQVTDRYWSMAWGLGPTAM